MKVRDSGMPEQALWESFFDAPQIIRKFGINRTIGDVAEFGCGYGTFTIPVARQIKGKIYALDIDPEMVAVTQALAQEHKLDNVVVVHRDFILKGTGLPDRSVDYVMLFNILHLENPVKLLRETRRILKTNGLLGIIHWNYDPATPRGPSLDIRPKPEQCVAWALQAGFGRPVRYDLKPYHYGIVLRKSRSVMKY